MRSRESLGDGSVLLGPKAELTAHKDGLDVDVFVKEAKVRVEEGSEHPLFRVGKMLSYGISRQHGHAVGEGHARREHVPKQSVLRGNASRKGGAAGKLGNPVLHHHGLGIQGAAEEAFLNVLSRGAHGIGDEGDLIVGLALGNEGQQVGV